MGTGLALVLFSMTAIAPVGSSASTSDTQRFQLTGEGTLHLDQPLQKSGNVQLKASLTPSVAAPAASLAQKGDRFALTALLSASSLVCYNDTIFRDGFDGTGL